MYISLRNRSGYYFVPCVHAYVCVCACVCGACVRTYLCVCVRVPLDNIRLVCNLNFIWLGQFRIVIDCRFKAVHDN